MSPAPRIKTQAVSSPQCPPARGTAVLPSHSTSSCSFLDVKYPPPWWPIFITRTPCLPPGQRSPLLSLLPSHQVRPLPSLYIREEPDKLREGSRVPHSQESFILVPDLTRGGKKAQEGGWWPQAANTPPPNLEQGRLAVGFLAAPKSLPSPHRTTPPPHQTNCPLELLGGFLNVAEPGDVSLISAWLQPPTLSLKPKAGAGLSCDFSSGIWMQARHRNFKAGHGWSIFLCLTLWRAGIA